MWSLRIYLLPEFIGDLMKIPGLVQGGREGGREGANRDTTGEIGEKIVTDILLHRD